MTRTSKTSLSSLTPEEAAGLSLAEQHEWYRKSTSRRTVLRSSVVGAGTLAAAGALGTAGASAATGTPTTPASSAATASTVAGRQSGGSTVLPFGRHINFGADPTSQLAVSWQVRAPVNRPFVRVGTHPGDLGQYVEAEIRPLTSQMSWQQPIQAEPLIAPTQITQYYVHASLDRLLPNTVYYYAVGHDGFEPGPESVASFRTAPAPSHAGAFTFTAFGDQGVNYDGVATGNLVGGINPAFHLHMGDICYADTRGHGLITDSYDARVWDSFFIQNEHVASRVPWMVAIGNHDMEAWYSANGYGGMEARFTFPGGGPTPCPGSYSWQYGNVGLISLDANDISYAIPANYGYSGGAQTAWLQRRLAEFRASATVDFIVIYFHHSTYTTCVSDGAEGGAQDIWGPLFDRYQVDLVLNGHNHVYERTDPIRGGSSTTAAPIGSVVHSATAGTTYVVAGGGGNSVYSFSSQDSYEGNVTPDGAPTEMLLNVPGGGQTPVEVTWSRVRYTGYSLAAVDVMPRKGHQPAQMTLRALAEDGTEVDRVILQR